MCNYNTLKDAHKHSYYCSLRHICALAAVQMQCLSLPSMLQSWLDNKANFHCIVCHLNIIRNVAIQYEFG